MAFILTMKLKNDTVINAGIDIRILTLMLTTILPLTLTVIGIGINADPDA